MPNFHKNGLLKSFSLAMLTGVVLTTGATLTTGMSANAQNNAGLSALFGQKSQKFLPVHQAFGVSVQVQGDEVVATFKVTPKHYIYKDKLSLTLPDGVSMGAWQFDHPSTMIDDPDFGRVAVFEEDFVARAKLKANKDVDGKLSLRWQGCAKAGLCYPPEVSQTALVMTANTPKNAKADNKADDKPKKAQDKEAVAQKSASVAKADATNQAQPLTKTTEEQSAQAVQNKALPNLVEPITDDQKTAQDAQEDVGEALAIGIDETAPNTDNVAQNAAQYALNHDVPSQDPFGIGQNPLMAIGLLFLAGLLLSLTPCVYPMIPIVANIVARQNRLNSAKGVALSSAYGLGVATAYGLLGALIAWFGQTINILGYLQNPAVLIGFAVLFAVLALYMFDVIKVGLPSAIKDKLQAKSSLADDKLGSVFGSFMAGVLSALVVSPCVSAPMAGALAAVSVSGSVLIGFLALFALGLGLSVPLMFIGFAQGRFMPKAGSWMLKVKEFCGLLLFAVALGLLERVWLSPIVLVLWAVWFLAVAVWLWRIAVLPSRAVSLLSGIWAVCLIVGASLGQTDAWQPLAALTKENAAVQSHKDIKTTQLSELDGVLASHEKVLVDVTADWCVECRIMERELFAKRPADLMGVQVVKFDITNTTKDSRALLERYQLMGPPALLLYKEGKLQRVMLGQTDRTTFEDALANF